MRQQLQAADQKANNSLGVEPFVMSWQQASSGLTWGQGGVPLLGNLHILSPLFLFHTLLLGNTLLLDTVIFVAHIHRVYGYWLDHGGLNSLSEILLEYLRFLSFLPMTKKTV